MDGQPIEFPVEMAGAEQDLGSGPITLQPNGRGIETSTHKYIAFDSGETALYDLVADPDGLNNIAADPSQSALVQELSVKLANFPAAAPAPMEAIPVPSTPNIPKVTVPAPISAQTVDPQPEKDTPSVPLLAKPVGSLPPPMPKPSDVKLPELGLPPGVGDSDKGQKAVLPPLKPSEVPELKGAGKPTLPPLPKPAVNLDQDQQSAALKKDLLETFDTDGDGKISEEEKPSEAQLKKFSDRRREKPKVDSVNTKRKSRLEAETAVKAAMRELEEARMREEMSVLEELEAHKVTRDKAKRACDQCDEEIDKLKQTDRARCEKSEAAIDKLKQEYEHDEELIRHGVRTKKAARLDDEDRIHELEDELEELHKENAARLQKEEEEDLLRQEERRLSQERYMERVKVDEQEKAEYEEDLRNQEEGEKKLKQEMQSKELQMQERLRLIKFEEDDEHSRIEHEIEMLEKSREKLQSMENIEDQEIRDLSAKVDARRIAVANEKKVERRMAVAEHEADILNQVRSEELPVAAAKPTIDRDDMQVPNPDMEPTLSKKPEPIKALPVSSDPEIREAMPVSMPSPKPVVAPAKPKLPKSQDEDHEEKDVLPAIIKPSSKSSRLAVSEGDEKPAFPLPDSIEPVGDLPALPEIPQSDIEDTGKQKKSPGFLKKLFGNKKKADPKSASKDIPLIPQPKTEGPKPDLPPLPTALTPTKTSADIPELPPLSGQSDAESPEEMERKTLERKLERIADKRAERINEPTSVEPPVPGLPKPPTPAEELPALPSVPGGLPPSPLAGGEKSSLPSLTKPSVAPSLPKPGGPAGGLPPLPSPIGGDKPALPPLPKPGVPSGGPSPLPSPVGGAKPALPPLTKPGIAPSLPKPGGPSGGLPPLSSPVAGDKPGLPPLPKPGGPVGGLPPLPGNDK